MLRASPAWAAPSPATRPSRGVWTLLPAGFVAIFNGANYLYGRSLNGLFVDNIANFYRSILLCTLRRFQEYQPWPCLGAKQLNKS